MSTDAPTVDAALRHIANQFAEADLHYGHGTDNAWDEAVYLVLSIAGIEDDQALLGDALEAASWRQIQDLALRRVTERVPLPYLLGRCLYAGLSFQVAAGVLIPRSPLGPWLVAHADTWLKQPPRRILDLCTGSGCLGILAAKMFPRAHVVLTDLDQNALALAARNVHDHRLADRVLLAQMDGAEALSAAHGFDLVLCNPPYVDAQGMAKLPPEYSFEPSHALLAGDDGMTVMAPILERLSSLLSHRGLFIGEVGLSHRALEAQFAHLPLVWLDFAQGGEGVFAVLAEDIARLA